MFEKLRGKGPGGSAPAGERHPEHETHEGGRMERMPGREGDGRTGEEATRVTEGGHDHHAHDHAHHDHEHGHGGRGAAAAGGAAAGASTRDVRGRQRDEFGGFNLGSAFFGWLVATGLAILLIAIIGAAGAAIGLSENANPSAQNAGTIGTLDIVGAIVVLAILALAYYCGGYVAGRMSRFDGARQGFGVWAIGIIITLLLAAAGAIFGAEYNVLQQLNLPRIPVDEGELATGGIIALAAWLLAMLVAAILGGKVGERFHKKVDRAGGLSA